MTRSRRAIIVVGAAATIGVGVVLLSPSTWRTPQERAEAESFRVLDVARTPDELDEAVGGGLVIPLKAGGWVAIRYVDNHHLKIWSSAVARDSGGGWFVSDRHFCGYLRESLDPHLEENQGVPREVRAVRDAPDLAAARLRLIDMQFRPADPPR